VHVASAFPLTHHYRAVLVWGFYPQVNGSCLVIIEFAQNKIEFICFLCFLAHKGMTTFEMTNVLRFYWGEEVSIINLGQRKIRGGFHDA